MVAQWCWFGLQMNHILSALLAYSYYLIVFDRQSTDKVFACLILSNIGEMQHILVHLLHAFGNLQGNLISTERVFKMLDVESEKDTHTTNDVEFTSQEVGMEQSWPQKGGLVFKNVQLRYRPNTELVLKGLSFNVQGGHKIGVVGRTGAGKSTISMAITRIVEIEGGAIELDGQNISHISLDRLREKITIIPQDPTFFSGTLRFNLDPLNNHPDSEILALMKEAGLENILERATNSEKKEEEEGEEGTKKTGLDLEIAEGGNNLSGGEKQLLCICRAILRQNKVIIMDEATANIDIATEQKIQHMINVALKDCTVMTIAHRLQTIIDSDRVMVMGEGQLLEYDAPQELMKQPDSYFTKLIKELKAESTD